MGYRVDQEQQQQWMQKEIRIHNLRPFIDCWSMHFLRLLPLASVSFHYTMQSRPFLARAINQDYNGIAYPTYDRPIEFTVNKRLIKSAAVGQDTTVPLCTHPGDWWHFKSPCPNVCIVFCCSRTMGHVQGISKQTQFDIERAFTLIQDLSPWLIYYSEMEDATILTGTI